ncbi:single-stranded-DNA-specific exonuclease RecJ [soil metagenome]
MEKTWKLSKSLHNKEQNEEDNLEKFVSDIRALNARIEIPEVLLNLLYNRSINSYPKILKFFRPTLDKLYDPFLMKDCEQACVRLLQAIEDKEKIMILGDYDVDGTCGVSMFYLFLKKLGLDPLVYIPDRILEGYGISFPSIDIAHTDGIKLIVSIDCGITAFEKIEYAKKHDIEFIICDHHQAPEKIPDALSVIDPVRKDCEYPFKHLCGTGVAFKLIQAVCKRLNKPSIPESLLDFVAIATASDIVSLTDENRILVSEGLKIINRNPRPSIKKLIENSGLKLGNINTTNIVYTLAPRINAVGRLGDAKRAVELLTSEDMDKMDELAGVLEDENKARRDMDKLITDTAYEIYEDTIREKNTNAIIIHNGDWHAGVIGIVAARLVEKYNLPSIVLTTVNGVAKGSARSINGFNIYEALKRCEEHLIQFGGHYHAAGLELELNKIEAFKEKFSMIAAEIMTEELKQPELDCDAEINLFEIDDKFERILSFFEPYGPGNACPLFISKNVEIAGDIREARGNTRLFSLQQRNSKFDAVFFNSESYKSILRRGSYYDVCYSVDKSRWNGEDRIKLKIKDIKLVQN